MSGYRREYTRDEDQQIVDYILQNDAVYKLRGTAMWKQMEQSKQFDRTWQSLKNRFLKKIYDNMHLMDIEHADSEKIRKGFQATKNDPKMKDCKYTKQQHDVEFSD
ncbi:PREDICTED: telomeric repeat-binding factor 2-interacting protein 1-like [Nicrophorus vespilloides]|uniref:Telomeric repeat-binding factor 2-interacting protein 1 n=1 Tax=Nicrophorus vespilloides TaxID=110193 RepID=A0ABM1M9L0_NICVS|nr:PREDICTED: telomeric repeat-binding factor 2-interacting protein 1-like [Nicrophorus vespilloides]